MHINTTGSTVKRCVAVICVFSVFLLYLVVTLFRMQIINYEYYQQRVINEITTTSTLSAQRGNIYDSQMNLLATNVTVWRIFISPTDIQSAINESKTDGKVVYYDEIIAAGLSEILGVDYQTIYDKAQKLNRLDETIKKQVDEETKDAVLAFISENGLDGMIYTEASYKRYYCYNTLASHALGFTGSDSQGLFGLEAYYDEYLSGKDGYYVVARDSHGSPIPYDYNTYVEAQDGCDLVTTLDMYIQHQLEAQLEATYYNSAADNRVCGVVMNVNTGAILAMATYPAYDLNDPYTLDSDSQAKLNASGYDTSSSDYTAYKSDLLYKMWNNKAVSEIYEPGSTFKIITYASAIETGAVNINQQYTCVGSLKIGGYRIRCHKTTGHGTLTVAGGLQQSCNPVTMQVVAKLGKENFYNFVNSFGYLSKTGIDLPSESGGIFHSYSAIGETELATASFGQRFKTSIMQQITAIAAVANGGYLVTPHLVSSIVDADGNIIKQIGSGEKRQVISESTSQAVTKILADGVSGNGASKNAYVAGYSVAAKTGTSEKFDILDSNGNSYLRIGSCVAYAPADDPEIAVLIVVDEPQVANVYGSMVAAPYISALLADVLPYLGYEPTYTASELAALSVTIGNYKGSSVEIAKSKISSLGLKYEIVGNGTTVVSQSPAAWSKLNTGTGNVILYTEGEGAAETVPVPDVMGKSATIANQILINAGLNINIEGTINYTAGSGAVVISQSVPAGTYVEKGTVITLTFRFLDSQD